MRKYLRKGDFVKVTMDGNNASQFNKFIENCPYNGVYSIPTWRSETFEVVGNFEHVTFNHNPEVFGAYPLALNNEPIGYVYNIALKKVGRPNFIFSLKNFENFFSDNRE